MTAVGGNDPQAKDGSTWKPWDEFYALDGATWKPAANVYVNYNGTWKEVWNHSPIVTSTSSSDSTQTPTFLDVAASSYGRESAQLGYSGYLSGSATEFFYLYRKSGVTTYTESSNGSLTGLEFGGATGTTYYHKTVGYNGKRRITVNATVNSNGVGGANSFPLTAAKVEYSSSSTFASNVTTVTLGIPTPTGTVYTFQDTFTLPTLTRGATDTYPTVYYRFTFTNASGTVVSSTGSRSLSPKYSPSGYATVGAGETSFTTYRYRTDTYTTVGSSTWSYTPPTGGVAVDYAYVSLVGGGGGGGKGNSVISGAGGAGGGGGGQRNYKAVLVNGNSATVVVGGGGQGGGVFGTDGWNGNSGGNSSFTCSGTNDSVVANRGYGGQSSASYVDPYGGGNGIYSGGSGYYVQDWASIGGGGGGTSNGGSASSTAAGNGGYGSGLEGWGGGGAGVYITATGGIYGIVYTVYYVGGSGGDYGGNGNGNGAGSNAAGYGCGGGGGAQGNGGNGSSGRVQVSYYGA